MLKAGEYDWWVEQMETHICSLDGQLWKVIEMGPETFLTTDGKEEKKKGTIMMLTLRSWRKMLAQRRFSTML